MNTADDQILPEYDAVLLVSFGGPERPDDVMPFLENVLHGRNVPRERMLNVAEHYYHFGGKSPINDQNRALIVALREELDRHDISLPIYFGNRNWHPLLADTMREMERDGIRRALAFFTSAYSSYSGCRQYRENIAAARQEVGDGAPVIDKIRAYFNHPGFVEVMVDRVQVALRAIYNHGASPDQGMSRVHALFTAHSIPTSMADGCNYTRQLQETSRLVAEKTGLQHWELVYQSRSGPPSQPWLEPDVVARIRQLADKAERPDHLFVVPIGFISDHMEVIHDLDTEAADVCRELDLPMTRIPTAGTHPRFVAMIRELIQERLRATPVDMRGCIGSLPPLPDVCPVDCCLPARRIP
jgi:protoporphyrin/coproporphyrin ferrochelatase